MNNKSGYLGNPNLKAVGVNIDFTEEQIKEYVKCAKDPVYFIKQQSFYNCKTSQTEW